MGIPLVAAMPPDTELDNMCQVFFAAMDPTTGNNVSGVLYTQGTLWVDVTAGADALANSGPFMITPGPGATL